MKPNSTTEYRAKLALPNNVTHTITAADQSTLQRQVEAVILNQPGISQQHKGSAVRFEEVSQGNSFITHASHLNGEKPLGWITSYPVPQNMGVKFFTEQSEKAQKAA
jgi:hypothetical protein